MQITTITVSSQRKLPHPSIDYANVSSLVSISAELGDRDDPAACAKKLQAQADTIVERHLDAVAERLRPKPRAAAATADTAARLAEKHAGAR